MKVILLAGGFGTRLSEYTKTVPKPMIRIGDNIAFAIYEGTTSSDIGILEFSLDDEGLPEYQDYYTNLSDETITEIRDLDIFQDSLYVTTDKGIFSGNFIDGNLKSATYWITVYSGTAAQQFIPGDSSLILENGSIINLQGADYCVGFTFPGNVIQAKSNTGTIGVLTEEYYYEIDNCVIDTLHIPVGDLSNTSNGWNIDLRAFFTFS